MAAPPTAASNREFHSSGYLPTLPRETSPFSEFVNNGPTRIMMPGQQHQYRVPEPIPPPWVGVPTASAASTASNTTEHAYAMPARIVRATSESLEHVDPRSVGSLVSLDSSSRTLCVGESVPSVPSTVTNDSDPVISRIKRDFERKQEFLRTTNLPNYLASPVSEEYPPRPPPVTQEEQRPPVYFGDRFPIHHPRPIDEEDSGGGHHRDGQFHLYGLHLGKRTEFFENLKILAGNFNLFIFSNI